MLHMKFGFVYSPGQEQTTPLGTKCFHKHISSVHLHTHSEFPQLHFNNFSPFKCMGDLSCPCRKTGQGHHSDMIYTNLVELYYCLMLHAKFQKHRPSVVETKIFNWNSALEAVKMVAFYSRQAFVRQTRIERVKKISCLTWDVLWDVNTPYIDKKSGIISRYFIALTHI